MNKRMFAGVLVAFLLVLVSGCGIANDNGSEESSEVTIEKDKAQELELKLSISAGELNVNSGANEWVEGTIDYNNDKFEPEVSYLHVGEKGTGTIEQKKIKANIGKLKNNWNLRLNDEVPIELNVTSGASKTKLDLKGLKLSRLEVDAGVGDITIDLGGKWKESFDASLEMGVGKSTIILPADVGVKINAEKGIGKTEFFGLISKGNGVYVNEAYDDADVIINITTEMGVGEAVFEMEK